MTKLKSRYAAVRRMGETFQRTKKDAGFVTRVEVVLYDKGLWQINGEVCEGTASAIVRLALVMDRMEGEHRKHLAGVAA
ncbi:MAG: hypothetical protein FWC87_00065 [Acidimicrobiaceae bacterium]|nr:hypothetical protein [Acidimicrobiaceae bacterium]